MVEELAQLHQIAIAQARQPPVARHTDVLIVAAPTFFADVPPHGIVPVSVLDAYLVRT